MESNLFHFAITFTIIEKSLPSRYISLIATRRYCGFQHSDDYPRDSDQISLFDFPWIAQLLYDEEKTVRCVGVLFNRRYVLTTASCLKIGESKITAVRFGDYDVTTNKDCINDSRYGVECSDPVREFGVDELIPHHKFDFATTENDIGLIRLSDYVEYTEYIRPICLPTASTLESGEHLTVSGWGYNKYMGRPAKIKKKILANIISLDVCRDLYYKISKFISTKQFCVSEEPKHFTCQGDGGSPLMASTKNQWEVIGLVSFGRACGYGYPTVYTNVKTYLSWIKDNLRP